MSKTTTKLMMSYALREVAKEKSINKITINDIAERCEINRQTFYYHFTDIYDLLEWTCLISAEDAIKNNKTYKTWQAGLKSLLELMYKDRNFIENIYHSISTNILIKHLYTIVYDLLYSVIEEKTKDLPLSDTDKMRIANFYKYGFVGQVLEWVDKHMSIDIDELVFNLDLLLKGTIEASINNLINK